VELTWLEGQTWRHVQRAMRGGPWHVFHFIGHGGFDATADEGVIALANDDGTAHLLRATELGRLLANHDALRMVILNACEGAKSSQRDIFSSTAATLARRGIPAVLAMQEEITDHAAIECTRAFYEALSDGLPVDASVSEARTAISVSVANTLEWGTPVLYMRSPDGVLFDIAKATALPKPAPATVKAESPPTPPAKPVTREAALPLPDLEDDPEATQVGPGLNLRQAETPKTLEQWLDVGYAASNERRYEAALDAYEHAIALDPNDAERYSEKGSALFELKRYQEALAAYERSLELDPHDHTAHYHKGLSLWELGRDEEALAAYEHAIQLYPSWAVLQNARGDILRKLRRYDEALAAYGQAITLEEHDTHTDNDAAALYYNNKGCVLLDLERRGESLDAYEQAIKLNPDYGIAYRNKGDVLYEMIQHTGAYIAYKKAIDLNPDDAYALQGLGDVLMQRRRFPEALEAFERVIALLPDEGLAYNSKGAALEELGREDDALQAYDKAIACNARDAFAWRNKGNLLKGLGRDAEAREALEKASELGL
jgi:tetratricopeptide (TPR) repeat protein